MSSEIVRCNRGLDGGWLETSPTLNDPGHSRKLMGERSLDKKGEGKCSQLEIIYMT